MRRTGRRSPGSLASVLVPVGAICVAFGVAIGITVWLGGGAGGAVSGGDASPASAAVAAISPSASATSSSSDSGLVVHNEGSTVQPSSKSSSSGSRSTGMTEEEFYEELTSAYDAAGDFNTKLGSCISAYNSNVLKESKDTRQSSRTDASTLRSKISKAESALKELDVPLLTENEEAWDDLCELYECLYKRIDVLVQSWDISLKYEEPEEHETEIIKPVRAQQDSSGNDIYMKRYKELYSSIKIVKPSKETRGSILTVE